MNATSRGARDLPYLLVSNPVVHRNWKVSNGNRKEQAYEALHGTPIAQQCQVLFSLRGEFKHSEIKGRAQ
jgi:hypothetical protein